MLAAGSRPWSKTIFAGNTFSARFCGNTGEKALERISMCPAGVSLVLPQNRCAVCDSIQNHLALLQGSIRRVSVLQTYPKPACEVLYEL